MLASDSLTFTVILRNVNNFLLQVEAGHIRNIFKRFSVGFYVHVDNDFVVELFEGVLIMKSLVG
jgi:hypothetical protein